MAWVRIDDHFDEHPKMQRVGPLAWGYWLAGLAYCNRNLTDGFIPWNKARTLCSFEIVEDDGLMWELSRVSGHAGEDMTAEWLIGLLIDAELWEEVKNGKGRVDGYLIHDYPDYQPLKAQIEEERAKKVAAGQAGGKASAQARAQASAQAEWQAPAQAKSKQSSTPNPNPIPSNNHPSDGGADAPAPDPPRSRSRQARKAPIPDDFAMAESTEVWCKKQGYSRQLVEREVAAFVLSARANGRQYSDWQAALRMWLTNCETRGWGQVKEERRLATIP